MSGRDLHDRLDRVLRRALPDVRKLLRVERLSGGASQETYRVVVETEDGERSHAMRRAPGGAAGRANAMGGPGLEIEARLFAAAAAAGVPVPGIHLALRPEDGLGAGFLMDWLDGETLGSRILKSEALSEVRPKLARECGRILGRIHDVDLDATGLRGALREADAEATVRDTWQRYQSFGVPQPMIDYGARWLLANLPAKGPLRLVHGDFRNGNLMVTPEGVAAVLDWELAHAGDPMRDLGWLCTASWRFGSDLPVGGFGSREELFAGYEQETGRRVDPASVRFWEVFGSFWWSVACLEMAMHARTGPDRGVERAAIGRRTSEAQVDCVNLLLPGPVALVAEAPPASLDLPRDDELLERVAAWLRDEVMEEMAGRSRFLARVSANALDVVRRERALGPPARAAEQARLEALLRERGPLEALRERLCGALREGRIALDDAALQTHLRHTVVNQVAIDQPRYAGLARALGS